MPQVNLLEAAYVPTRATSLPKWLNYTLQYVFSLVKNDISLDKVTLWIAKHTFDGI